MVKLVIGQLQHLYAQKGANFSCLCLATQAVSTNSGVSFSFSSMEASIAHGLSGLDPVDLQGRDQEALADLIATYFGEDSETFEGRSIATDHGHA